MIFNLMDGKDYYSQRNNVIDPNNACMPTAFVQAFHCLGKKFPNTEGQPEDSLLDFVRNDPGMKIFYQQEANEFFKKNYPANEVHVVMVEGANRWIGEACVKSDWATSVRRFKMVLDRKQVIVTTGMFPGLPGGHAICITGYEMNVEDDYIEHFFIQDPWGNCLTKYADRNGRNVRLTGDMLHQYLRPKDHPYKIAHVVS